MRILLTLVLLAVPICSAHAEGFLSRKDGYLLIWQSINRPAEETNEKNFTDVPEDLYGWLEITYGKNRGIIDDDSEYFYPDAPLTRSEAILWLFRTRNVDDISNIQYENLDELIQRYPFLGNESLLHITSDQQLIEMIQSFDKALREEVHEISNYGEAFHGKGTAFGESFDMYAMTAAHRTYPYNTKVKVTNIENGKSVIVRINDRGPFVDGRDMDLSHAAFYLIAPGGGIANATFERLGDENLIDRCSNEQKRYQKRITRDVRFHRGVPHILNLGETLTLGSNRWFVVRGIIYPDESFTRFQEFISPEERFLFVPSTEGEYKFLLGTMEGRQREMIMNVSDCGT